MLKYIIIFSAALVSGMLFTSLFAKAACKYKLLKTKDIPLVGGLGIGLAFVFSAGLSIFMFALPVAKILAVLGAALIILISGVVDDLKESSVLQKFLVQSFCALFLILSGIKTDIMYLNFWGNILITFFWIVGITNAFNLLDIMDGLAGGTALIVSAAFLLIGFLSFNLNVQIFSLILCAVSAGFLIFNFPPAKIYLGNSGSHFLGLLISAVALMTHYASADNVFALLSPVMILGLPIMDTILLIIFRVIKRKVPFKKSRDHVALKIGALGISPLATVLGMYLLCFIFTGCGVILSRVNSFFAGSIIIFVFLFSIGIFMKLVKIEAYG
ncbi:MAG TPA: MraY family glycosyltransferase [Candidatus Omnitrophota bacterium]|nr:MraY family glycosyltransferase [Candidatus Omnitrophota bacterium]HPT39213.1 MraY family glycosyltransferase [Candidatus Omnitrophota bacterium]